MSGFVYVIQDGNGLCKIGRARDVAKRLRGLSTAASSDLKLVASWHCDDAGGFESLLHRAWARVRVRGEWFRIPEATLEAWRSLDGRATLTTLEFQAFMPNNADLFVQREAETDDARTDMPAEDGMWWVSAGTQQITCKQCNRLTNDSPAVMRYVPRFDFRGIQAREYPDWQAFGWVVWRQCEHCSWMDFTTEYVTTNQIREWGVGPWRPNS